METRRKHTYQDFGTSERTGTRQSREPKLNLKRAPPLAKNQRENREVWGIRDGTFLPEQLPRSLARVGHALTSPRFLLLFQPLRLKSDAARTALVSLRIHEDRCCFQPRDEREAFDRNTCPATLICRKNFHEREPRLVANYLETVFRIRLTRINHVCM